ncbi:hypothetical protein LCGC14_0165470 [marine sediment metagenome]|uniref:HNH nuclease domain-containing protein n=1 Tax=marine sediment metagenome TaxID=412755 RepID=A0A0F9VAW8_9ZZZZ
MTSLEEPALVLNRSWSLIGVTTAADAMCKLFKGTAHVIHHESFEIFDFEAWAARPNDPGAVTIKTPHLLIQVPEVIKECNYGEIPQHGLKFSRYHVFKRDHYCCQYCGRQVKREEIQLEHIVPKAQGGQTAWDNCVSACEPCNAEKADRTPAQAGMRLLKHPIKPDWSPGQVLRRFRNPKESWKQFVN